MEALGFHGLTIIVLRDARPCNVGFDRDAENFEVSSAKY